MYKYIFSIDNESYIAVFSSHSEAMEFIREVEEEDSSEVAVNSVIEVSALDIATDTQLERLYKIELLGILLLSNHKSLTKFTEVETELRRQGFSSFL